MADSLTGPAPRCQWCSAELPAPDLPTCPSCGATLTSTGGTEDIKGVTTLDPEAILRARADVARPRSRLLSFITGEVPVETGGPASAESLAPPDNAVRLEMLRLEMEAERADLEAEAVSMKTDTVLEQGIDLGTLADDADVAAVADEAAMPAANAGEVPGVADDEDVTAPQPPPPPA